MLLMNFEFTIFCQNGFYAQYAGKYYVPIVCTVSKSIKIEFWSKMDQLKQFSSWKCVWMALNTLKSFPRTQSVQLKLFTSVDPNNSFSV